MGHPTFDNIHYTYTIIYIYSTLRFVAFCIHIYMQMQRHIFVYGKVFAFIISSFEIVAECI